MQKGVQTTQKLWMFKVEGYAGREDQQRLPAIISFRIPGGTGDETDNYLLRRGCFFDSLWCMEVAIANSAEAGFLLAQRNGSSP
jgi:hypothetical protein